MTDKEDRSKPPDGLSLHEFMSYDGARWDVMIDGIEFSFTSESEALAAAWKVADQQRAIGAAQERERVLNDLVGWERSALAERDARVRREALLEAAQVVWDIGSTEGIHAAMAKLRELADAEGGG